MTTHNPRSTTPRLETVETLKDGDWRQITPCVAGNDHKDIEHYVPGIGWCEGHCPGTEGGPHA